MEVNIRWARMYLSNLFARIKQSQETPTPSPARRELGWARGEFTVPDNFDEPLPLEVENTFYR